MPFWRVRDLPWSDVAELIRFRNQTGSLLLLFPTLWALVLAADGRPPLVISLIFIAGTFLMRSAGVIINDWWDRHVDRRVIRTQTRPLAAGRLSPITALALFVLLILIAAGLVLFLNPLTIALAPIALGLAVLYPLAKRVVPIPQAVLGIAFGWGAIMAWTAIRGEVGGPAVGIFLATIFWAVGYDTIYALQDKEDDSRVGIRSSALFFGRWAWLAVLLSLLTMTATLAAVGLALNLAMPFYLTLLTAVVWFAYQARRVKDGVSRLEAFGLFKQHVWIGALILSGIWAGLQFR
ncbi:MAG TPA: 4-hydroxybenzoate octaprenyltransferase [Nitrospirales bacterium]|jgi:4-hydroxybenzoate polyprenyltransferase